MKLLCKPREIDSKIDSLKGYRNSYVYLKFDLQSRFKLYLNVDGSVREELHLEILRLSYEQLVRDLKEFDTSVDNFYEFTNKIRVAMEYNAEIYIDTFEEVTILDFINKKLKYYEEYHEQTRTT